MKQWRFTLHFKMYSLGALTLMNVLLMNLV